MVLTRYLHEPIFIEGIWVGPGPSPALLLCKDSGLYSSSYVKIWVIFFSEGSGWVGPKFSFRTKPGLILYILVFMNQSIHSWLNPPV